jgi:hypothetical protein
MFLLSSVYLVHWHARILFLKERNLCDFSLQTQMFVFSAMLTIGVRCRFHGAAWLLEKRRFSSPFVRLVVDGWCWFVLREKYCWLVCSERKVPLAGG